LGRHTDNKVILQASFYIFFKIKRMGLKEGGYEGMDWINLAGDRDQWRAPVNTVKNLRVLRKAGDSRPAQRLLAMSRSDQFMNSLAGCVVTTAPVYE
jgi:hypothetical protein